MAEYRHYAKSDPEWIDVCLDLHCVVMPHLTRQFPNNLPPNTRVVGMNRNRLPIEPQEGLDIFEFDITARDDYPIRVRQYRQSKLDDRLPLFIYMHGGGWVTGSLETDDQICRTIVTENTVTILQIEYRLAPEHKFPVGFEDCHDVVRWAASDAGQKKLHVDLTKGFLLGGTSAGSNFTAGIVHLARDEELSPPVTGLVLLAGNICHPDARPAEYKDRILSVDEVNDAPGLTRKSIDYFSGMPKSVEFETVVERWTNEPTGKYGAPPTDKRLSPLLFESHRNIGKKAYFAICGWDPRRDESILFSQLLGQVGIHTRHHVYSGLPHGFWATCPDLPVSKKAVQDLSEGVMWLLE